MSVVSGAPHRCCLNDALCTTKEPGHGHSSPQGCCAFLGSARLYEPLCLRHVIRDFGEKLKDEELITAFISLGMVLSVPLCFRHVITDLAGE